MIILLLLMTVCSFSVGYALGALRKPKVNKVKHILPDSDLEVIQKEYENFLNYDGSTQL